IPPVALLDPASGGVEPPSPESLEFTSRLIETKLADFGVEVKVLAAYPGPVITRYEIEPATGVKGSQVVNLAKDLARAVAGVDPRRRDRAGQVLHGARAAQPEAADGAPVGDHRFQGVPGRAFAAYRGARQGHRWPAGGGRP